MLEPHLSLGVMSIYDSKPHHEFPEAACAHFRRLAVLAVNELKRQQCLRDLKEDTSGTPTRKSWGYERLGEVSQKANARDAEQAQVTLEFSILLDIHTKWRARKTWMWGGQNHKKAEQSRAQSAREKAPFFQILR